MSATVLAFLIDALGWQSISERPFLDDIIRTRCPLRTVLGFSSGAEPSILTGRAPAEHGRWTMYRHRQRRSPFEIARWLGRWPAHLPGQGQLRRFLTWWVRERENVRGYFNLYDVPLTLLPCFDLAERDELFQTGGIPGIPSLFDNLSDEGIPFRSWWWRTSDRQNFSELGDAIDAGESGFYFLYSPTFDAVQHVKGTESPEVADLLDDYEKRIRVIYRKAQKKKLDPRLFIFSDHGMTDTIGTVDLMRSIEELGLVAPDDYVPFYDSTMARFWFRSAGAREAILPVLARTEHGRILDDDELAREGVLFPDRRYGEVVFLMDCGWQIEPSFMGPRANRAMHGFHPDDPGSDAAFLSDRELSSPPADIRDLFDILLAAGREGIAP